MRSVVLAALLGGVTALGAHMTLERWLPDGSTIPGTELLGRVQPRGRPLLGWLDQLQSGLGERPVYLTTPSETLELKAFELGIHLDVTETARRIRVHAERGSVTDRLARAWRARQGHEHIEPAWSFDKARARARLGALASVVRRDAIDARLDLRRHERISEVPGRELSIDESLKSIRALTGGALTSVPLVFRELEPSVRLAELSTVDVTRVLSSFTTDFAKKAGPCAINIRTAARRLDGMLLPPAQSSASISASARARSSAASSRHR